MIIELNNKNKIIFGEKIDGINYILREGVYGVAFNDAGQVAVLKNEYGYFLPGGGLEDGEKLEECLVREFNEELGCNIFIDKFIGEASKYYFSEAFNQYRNPIGFFFKVIINDDDLESIEKNQTLIWMYPLDCIELLHEHQGWAVLEATKQTS